MHWKKHKVKLLALLLLSTAIGIEMSATIQGKTTRHEDNCSLLRRLKKDNPACEGEFDGFR